MDEDHKLNHLKIDLRSLQQTTWNINGCKRTFHGMGIIACSILNKDIPENKVKRKPTILKREAIERKNSIKHNWYQQKYIHLLSKIMMSPLKDIKEKLAVFRTVLNMDLLWHTPEKFYKAERQRPRPNWKG